MLLDYTKSDCRHQKQQQTNKKNRQNNWNNSTSRTLANITKTDFQRLFFTFKVSLFSVMNSICEHYSTMDQSQACITSPKVGQPCIAIFEEDSMWYRAKVESVSQSRATVQFVDYGNTQNVKVSDLKQIEAQFLKLPALAALCTVNPNKSTWSADETENFKVVTGEEKVSAEIIGKEGDRHVVRISQGRKCVTDSFTKTAGV